MTRTLIVLLLSLAGGGCAVAPRVVVVTVRASTLAPVVGTADVAVRVER